MRICFLSRRYFPAVSGMSVYARNMTNALAARGHDIVMLSQYRQDPKGIGIYGGGPPPDEPWMQVEGLRALGEEQADENTSADFEADLRYMVERAVALHQQQPFDLVHAQYCYPNGLAALEISRQLGIPNMVSIQGGDGHWVGLCCETHRQAMAAVLNHAMELVIGCDSFAEEVVHNHGIEKSRMTIIPGATNTEQFKPARLPDSNNTESQALLADDLPNDLPNGVLGQIETPARLLYHGRVDRRKGVLDFIQAGKQLIDRKLAVKLIVSGIGPDVEPAQRLTAELKLQDHVEFTGAVDYADAAKVYSLGDIFVSPTYAEGFSNTVLEAMASGLPIVSTNTVGVVDCLTNDVNGSLVEPGDVTALADALQHMIEDEAYRLRIVKQAYNDVIQHYSWPVIAGQLEARYKTLLTQTIDNDWTQHFDIQQTVEDADLSCRFRQQPHLL